ncbi:RES family NAD+ phosphorylase [Streptomyces sp. NPDC047082]|uniref:RES family NAD+ phosphorylase n=1 Tax=Streptomyces sp. NPDC047082 TaxID=3155259 RepID=UPI0033E1F506
MNDQPPADIQLLPPPETGVWRLDKQGAGLTYDLFRADDAAHRGGNRWSTSRCGVLYCSSHQDACYAEELVALRVHPDFELDARQDWQDANEPAPHVIVRDWTSKRTMLRLEVPKYCRFLDVDDDITLKVLTARLSSRLAELGVDEQPLTSAHTRGSDRRITRAITEWTLDQQTPEGSPRIHGITYRSNYAQRQCWAIYESTPVKVLETSYVYPESPPLLNVSREYRLRVL